MARTPEQALAGVLALLPTGFALRRDPGSNAAAAYWRPLAAMLARLELDAETLLPECDPRTAAQLLPDYERVLGPDLSVDDPAALTVPQRQASAWQRWTAQGGASRAFFVRIAAQLGYTARIVEDRPFYAEISHAEDPLASEDYAFVWHVLVAQPRDAFAAVLEAAIGRFRPSHTFLDFQYGVA